MSNLDTLRNEISETKFGQFYYKARTHYIEEESAKWRAEYEFGDLGTLLHFIEWFREEYGGSADPQFIGLIRNIKKLCTTKNKEVDYSACFKIIEPMLSFPDLLKSESHRKENYQRVMKNESQQDRRWKKGYEKYRNTANSDLPSPDEINRKYAIKELHKRGIIFTKPKVLGNFIRFMWTTALKHQEHSLLTDNAIKNKIADILNLLMLRTNTGLKFDHRNVAYYII